MTVTNREQMCGKSNPFQQSICLKTFHCIQLADRGSFRARSTNYLFDIFNTLIVQPSNMTDADRGRGLDHSYAFRQVDSGVDSGLVVCLTMSRMSFSRGLAGNNSFTR